MEAAITIISVMIIITITIATVITIIIIIIIKITTVMVTVMTIKGIRTDIRMKRSQSILMNMPTMKTTATKVTTPSKTMAMILKRTQIEKRGPYAIWPEDI